MEETCPRCHKIARKINEDDYACDSSTCRISIFRITIKIYKKIMEYKK